MNRLLRSKAIRDGLWGTALLCCALALCCWPKEVSSAVREGLGLCYNVILPSLFPFFILTSLAISLGLAGYLGRLLEPIMRPSRKRRLRRGPGPGLCWGIPRGRPGRPHPLRKRPVLQNRV